jgi:lipopolysaccharide cholinephosphotransferase
MPVKYAEGIFEGYGFYVPRNPEKFMTDFYGDYMKLPPENERITHAKLIKLEA